MRLATFCLEEIPHSKPISQGSKILPQQEPGGAERGHGGQGDRGQEKVTSRISTLTEGFPFNWWGHLCDVSTYVEPD